MLSREVLIRPIISEKSYKLAELGKYTFEVHPKARKDQIKRAIEEIFKVGVSAVNTLKVPGKPKRGRTFKVGHTKAWKKAIVSLKPGEKLEIFETG